MGKKSLEAFHCQIRFSNPLQKQMSENGKKVECTSGDNFKSWSGV